MQLGSRAVEVAHNRRHAGLVAHGGGEMGLELLVIFREAERVERSVLSLVVNSCGQGIIANPHLLTLPRWRAARLRGRKASEPWRGASNLRWDMVMETDGGRRVSSDRT